jgi:hypothetical protein
MMSKSYPQSLPLSQLKTEQKTRPSSTTSTETRNMTIRPHDFQMWKEEHALAHQTISGTSTLLPIFFQQSGPENQHMQCQNDEQIHTMYNSNNHGARSTNKMEHHHPFWSKHEAMEIPPTPMFSSSEFRDDTFGGHSLMHNDRRDMDYLPSSRTSWK